MYRFLPPQLLQPEFYDIFGIGVFSFLLGVAIWSIKTKEPLPNRIAWIILLISIGGLLVDGAIVVNTYFLGH